MADENKIPFKGLVISGGGTRGMVALGVLQYHHTITGRLKHSALEHVAGTSIGSVIALLTVCGYTPLEIFKRSSKLLSNRELFLPKVRGPGALLSMFNDLGVLSLKRFSERINRLVIKKLEISYSPTFLELYEMTGIHFSVCVSDVTNMREVRMDYTTHPKLGVTRAVEMSCAIPIIFQRVMYKGRFMADGGLTNNFPWQYIPPGLGPCLGVLIADSLQGYSGEGVEKPMAYLYNCIVLPTAQLTRLQRENIPTNIVVVRPQWRLGASLVNLLIEEKTMKKMFEVGVLSAYSEDVSVKLMVHGLTDVFNEHYKRVQKLEESIQTDIWRWKPV